MKLCNLGHAGFFVEAEDALVLVDPLVGGGDVEPIERVNIQTHGARAKDIVLTSADALHAHAPSLRELLGGRRLIAPADVLGRIGRVVDRAHDVLALEPFAPRSVAGIEWTMLPGEGSDLTVLARHGDDVVWFVGPASIDRNRALIIGDRLDGCRALAVLSSDVSHVSRVAHGGARGFPQQAVAERVRTAAGLRRAGFTLAVTGGAARVGDCAWANRLAAPLSTARLARELSRDGGGSGGEGQVIAPPVGRWFDTAGALCDAALETTRSSQVVRFDPSVGIPDVVGEGALVNNLAGILHERLAGLMRHKLLYGFYASLVSWDVRLEIRELGGESSRRTVATFGERSVNVETDPEGAGNVTLTLSSRSLAALLAGDVTAEALSASGRLRSSERLLRVNGASVQRPSWVGLQAPDSEVARSALGYLLSPLTLATLLSPQPALPRWPGRWLGEHAQP
ncbi:MAG: sterol carrier protein domain-containing protein [Myxococcales bacterium]|nr:sterol carrier protein domain-containing protein [Myxococcales bacterium]